MFPGVVVNALVAVANTPPLHVAGSSLVRRFLAWTARAGADERAAGISALARAYLYSDMPASVRAEAVMALTSALDDPSALVRRALAEAFASAADAPRHIVLALANDQSEVARVVLARSPLLRNAELVDCAAVGDAAAQTAIARRPRLGAPVAAALAEIGEVAAVIALLGNPGAEIGVGSLKRVFERFRDEPLAREALLGRQGLPAWLRAELVCATAADLARLTAGAAWLGARRSDRVARESREQAFVEIALSCPEAELPELVSWLRANDALTVALLMRSLMCGDSQLLRQSLIDMSGLPPRRVAGLLRDWRGHGFRALYGRAGMPAHFLPAFSAAVALAETSPVEPSGQVDYDRTTMLIRALEARADPALAPVLAMLWRFASEGARGQAREFALDATLEVAPDESVSYLEPIDFAPGIAAIEASAAVPLIAPLIELDLEMRDQLARAA